MAWYHRIRNVFQADRLTRDIDREITFHIQERADDLRAAGLKPGDAAHAARKQFGNTALLVDRTRELNIAGWLEAILRDARLAVRSLAKTPAFAVTVILTLALGIGANSAVFSVLDAVLLRPLPFPEADRLVQLSQTVAKSPEKNIAPTRLEDWNRLNSTFTAISGFYFQDLSETSGELPEKLRVASVAPRFLQTLGVGTALGRDFSPEEMRDPGAGVVIISDRFWRRRFNADPAVLGKKLRLGPRSPAIIGVMAPAFAYPDRETDVWSQTPANAAANVRIATWYTGIGRLSSGISLAAARENLSDVQRRLAELYPATDAPVSADTRPLKDAAVGGVRASVWMLFGSVWVLLLIACTNIAALLLARAVQRRHEIAVRFSLGASRARMAAQLLTETAVLAFAGAIAGLLVAAAASRMFQALAKNLPRVEEINLDTRVVLYTLACGFVVTFLCGLLPVIRSLRGESLARGSRTEVSGRQRLQWLLVGTQVALAVTLLAGAGLLVRSFYELGRVKPGFDSSNILAFHVTTSFAEAANSSGRTLQLLDGLRSIPGVEHAATSMMLPGVPGGYETEFKLAGRADPEPKVIGESRFVSASYFDTMRIPLVSGEPCDREPALGTVIVNQSFANRYLQGSAIGRPVSSLNSNDPPARIRGVAADARELGIHRAPVPTLYWCGAEFRPGTNFLLRTKGAPERVVAAVRAKLHELEPRRSMYDVMPLEERVGDAFAENRLRAVVLGFFAATAVSLACLGLYGTLSYLVNTRRREVGLRLALGAMRGQIAGGFLVKGLGIALVASIVGLGLALSLTRIFAEMLYGVSPSDPLTLTAVIAIVLLVASLASLLPARRASRVQPMQVLRDE